MLSIDMTPLFTASIVWTWFLVRDAYNNLKDKPNKFLSYCEGMVGCSKCLGFVLTLLWTGDLVAAAAVSIFFSVISYYNT